MVKTKALSSKFFFSPGKEDCLSQYTGEVQNNAYKIYIYIITSVIETLKINRTVYNS